MQLKENLGKKQKQKNLGVKHWSFDSCGSRFLSVGSEEKPHSRTQIHPYRVFNPQQNAHWSLNLFFLLDDISSGHNVTAACSSPHKKNTWIARKRLELVKFKAIISLASKWKHISYIQSCSVGNGEDIHWRGAKSNLRRVMLKCQITKYLNLTGFKMHLFNLRQTKKLRGFGWTVEIQIHPNTPLKLLRLGEPYNVILLMLFSQVLVRRLSRHFRNQNHSIFLLCHKPDKHMYINCKDSKTDWHSWPYFLNISISST